MLRIQTNNYFNITGDQTPVMERKMELPYYILLLR